MQVEKQSKTELTLSYESNRKDSGFSFRYRKHYLLIENRLHLSYEIVNTGKDDFPCFWTFHGLMRLETDMRLVYPPGVERFENVLQDQVLGKCGEIYPLKSERFDFSKLPDPATPYMMKYYCPDPVKKGYCALQYPGQGVQCEIRYDAEALPWIGVWITAGGFAGDYNLAMEMTGGYYDGIGRALENNKLWILNPGEKKSFHLELELSVL
jgi:galactose mutarotase-like enzyme